MNEKKLTYKEFNYIEIPALRFIGIDAWETKETWNELWVRKDAFLPQLEYIKEYHDNSIPYICAFLHHDDKEINDHGEPDLVNRYLVGRFFKAGTPVPDGFSYRDLESQTVGSAVFEKMIDIDDEFWQRYITTRDKILSDGFTIPYPVGYWHAEVYFRNSPSYAEFDCQVLFGCKKKI